MLEYNSAMAKALSGLRSIGCLPADLALIAEGGFYEKEGCEFLCHFKGVHTNVNIDSFEDRTGYECFINSIHVDDFVEEQWLGTALQFIIRLLDSWSRVPRTETLQIVLTSNELGATVKAHILRHGESWVSDDLEGYENPVLMAAFNGGDLRKLIGEMAGI